MKTEVNADSGVTTEKELMTIVIDSEAITEEEWRGTVVDWELTMEEELTIDSEVTSQARASEEELMGIVVDS